MRGEDSLDPARVQDHPEDVLLASKTKFSGSTYSPPRPSSEDTWTTTWTLWEKTTPNFDAPGVSTSKTIYSVAKLIRLRHLAQVATPSLRSVKSPRTCGIEPHGRREKGRRMICGFLLVQAPQKLA